MEKAPFIFSQIRNQSLSWPLFATKVTEPQTLSWCDWWAHCFSSSSSSQGKIKQELHRMVNKRKKKIQKFWREAHRFGHEQIMLFVHHNSREVLAGQQSMKLGDLQESHNPQRGSPASSITWETNDDRTSCTPFDYFFVIFFAIYVCFIYLYITFFVVHSRK